MADPVFIDTDINNIRQEIIDYWQTATGRVLQPAQIEALIIDLLAYREGLVRQAIQGAAEQNLIDYSTAPVIDYLGALIGVIRLAASPAICELTFNLTPGHGGVTVPAGTRVQSTDGKVAFKTKEDSTAIVGVNTLVIDAECVTAGEIGNGYAIGTISILLDVLAFVVDVENTTLTAGGADQEDDDSFRARCKLAPSQFTTAGSENSYKFHARTASPAIIDVAVTSPTPGDVYIWPLMEDGSVTPSGVLDDVEDACNAENVRPLSDTVTVQSPTKVDYDLEVNVTLFDTADAISTQAAIEEALELFTTGKRQTLGQDIILNQIINAAMVDGVYDIEVEDGASNPFADIIIDETEFGFCGTITVNIVGTTIG